jgi:hypothetical protein
VPQAAVVGLPRVERCGWLEDGTIRLRRLDLLGDHGDDPVDDREHLGRRAGEVIRPDDARLACVDQLDPHGDAILRALHATGHDVVDVEDACDLLGIDAAIA